jgi:hypothetical protein
MQEPKLLGTILPSSPDFLPIVRQLREKYGLPEIGPDDEPITEIFLDGEPVALEAFQQEIRSLVLGIPNLLPPDAARILQQVRANAGKALSIPWIDLIPEADRRAIWDFYDLVQKMGDFFLRTYGQFGEGIADMLYEYLLTGGVQEIPNDWIRFSEESHTGSRTSWRWRARLLIQKPSCSSLGRHVGKRSALIIRRLRG